MKKTSSKAGAGNVAFFPPSSSSSSLLNDFANMHLADDDVAPIGVGLFPQQHKARYQDENEREDMDIVKGYGLQSHQHYDHDDTGFDHDDGGDYYGDNYEEDEDVSEMLQEDKAPEMPTEYYEQVESFLKKPPPSLSSKFGYVDPAADVGGKKKKKKSKENPLAKLGGIAMQNHEEILPPISPQVAGKQGFSHNAYPPNHFKQVDEDQYEQPPKPPMGNNDAMTSNSGEKKKRKKVGNKLPTRETNRNIDHSLLREAFAYTDMLLREAVIEEATTNQQQAVQSKANIPKSAPAEIHYDPTAYMMDAGGGSGKNKKSTGAIGMVRNLKSNKSGGSVSGNSKKSAQGPAAALNHGDFQVSTDMNEPSSRKNAVNFDDLVSNFQNGTTLEKLKRELAQSQAILHQSESAIRELSGQYYQPRGKGK